MNTQNLAERVLALADETAASPLGTTRREELDAVREALREPLRVAVVGRVKAGKSTLVNALLGQRVAPTDVGECTRVVTWFRYGHPERVEVLLKDGGRRDVQLEQDGMLPATLGIDPGMVRSLQVWLSNSTLRGMTLIDTPGLGSLNQEVSAATEEFLALDQASAEAAGSAQALAFVLNETIRADEVDVLRRFRSSAGEVSTSAVNAVGVLTKADKVGGGGAEAWNAATVLAGRMAERLRNEVSAVVPVIGLIGETVEAALLTESDAAHLAALAGLEAATRTRLLISPDRFLEVEVPVPRQARERLLTLLDLYGVERALELLDRGLHGADALRTELRRRSGIEALRATLVDAFRRRDDALRARWGLGSLFALSFARSRDGDAAALGHLRDSVEAMRMDPAMHAVAELEALHACCSGEVTLPEELLEELRRIAGNPDLHVRLGDGEADQLARLAAQGAARWRRFRFSGATPRQGQVAQVMVRSYELAWEELSAGAAAE